MTGPRRQLYSMLGVKALTRPLFATRGLASTDSRMGSVPPQSHVAATRARIQA
jgi:hypothetical protein